MEAPGPPEAKGPDRQRSAQEGDFVRACFLLLVATDSPTKILYLTDDVARMQFLGENGEKSRCYSASKLSLMNDSEISITEPPIASPEPKIRI